jgi:hypothetical protein
MNFLRLKQQEDNLIDQKGAKQLLRAHRRQENRLS